MYVAAAIGGLLAAMWPDLVRLVRKEQPVALTEVLPSRPVRLVVLAVAGIILGVIAAAIVLSVFLGGTVTALSQRASRDDLLRYSGKAAYVLIFTAGFALTSFVSEPFKHTEQSTPLPPEPSDEQEPEQAQT